MRRLRGWLTRCASALRLRRPGRDIDAELESHLALHIDDNLRRGMSPDEARRAALLALGSVEGTREAWRDQDSIPALRALGGAMQHARRSLVRHWRFSLAIVLILGCGIGFTGALVSVVDVLMFRPPAHVRESHRLVQVRSARNFPEVEVLARESRTLVTTTVTSQTLSLGHGESARAVNTQCVTPTYFPVFGTAPVTGRGFVAADGLPGATPTAMLSHHVWQREFAADPATVGRTVSIGAVLHVVVGIAPSDFRGVDMAVVDAWILLTASPALCTMGGRPDLFSIRGSWLTTIARLVDDVELERANTEVRQLIGGGRDLASRDGDPRHVVPIDDARTSTSSGDRRLTIWLTAGAAMVLLLACANVAGLLWVRAIERRREIAIRLQLGASRARVFTQLMAEHVALAIAAGIAAWIIAGWIGTALRAFFPGLSHNPWTDLRTIVMLAIVVAVAALVAGVMPAAQTARGRTVELWRSGSAVGQTRSPIHRGLLVLQVAIALVLALGAGLFARSVREIKHGVGYDLDRVVVATFDLERAGIRRQAEKALVADRMLAAVAALPDVDAVALTTAPPLGSGPSGSWSVASPGRPPGATGSRLPSLIVNYVSPEYFRVLGTRLIEGRPFAADDRPSRQRVAILDATTVRDTWGQDSIVGQCVELVPGQSCTTVIGISEPRRIGTLQLERREVFYPLTTETSHPAQALLVRPAGAAEDAVAAIAAAIRSASPSLPFINVQPLADLADVQARSWRLGAWLFGLFGVVAVGLAAIGLYASLAYAVRQRTAEFGVRMTLGADARGIARLVLREGLALIALGWVFGAVAGAVFVNAIRSLLFGVAPTDPLNVATASLVVGVAGLTGCLAPAWRAARVDPVRALRTE
jgi:predicted permease